MENYLTHFYFIFKKYVATIYLCRNQMRRPPNSCNTEQVDFKIEKKKHWLWILSPIIWEIHAGRFVVHSFFSFLFLYNTCIHIYIYIYTTRKLNSYVHWISLRIFWKWSVFPKSFIFNMFTLKCYDVYSRLFYKSQRNPEAMITQRSIYK